MPLAVPADMLPQRGRTMLLVYFLRAESRQRYTRQSRVSPSLERSAMMRKKTIFWLVLTALILLVIGAAVFAPSIATAASHCTQEQINSNTCSITLSGAQAAGVVIGGILWLIGLILWFVAWIGALVRSAKMGSWVWFVVVLIFSGLGTLLYALFGPPDRPVPTGYPPYGYPPTGYPPTGYPPAGYPPGAPPPYPQS